MSRREKREQEEREAKERKRREKEEKKAERIVRMLFEYYIEHTEEIPHYTQEEGEQAVGDYIAGMTDVYAINEFKRIFMPDAWNKY